MVGKKEFHKTNSSNNAVAVIPPMPHSHVSLIFRLSNWQCSYRNTFLSVYIISILPVIMKSWTAHRRLVYVKYPFSLLLTVQFVSNTLNISSQYQHNVWEMVSFLWPFQCQSQSSKNSLQGNYAFIPRSFLFSTIRNFSMDDLTSLHVHVYSMCQDI